MNKLRNILVFVSCFSFILALNSCKHNQKQDENPSLYSSIDTTIVNDMVCQYLDLIHEKNYDQAFDMLYVENRDMAIQISDSTKQALLSEYETFPVLSYKIISNKWDVHGNVVLTTAIEFFEKPEGSDIPNTINLSFGPFRKNGIWYLSLSK